MIFAIESEIMLLRIAKPRASALVRLFMHFVRGGIFADLWLGLLFHGSCACRIVYQYAVAARLANSVMVTSQLLSG